MLFFSFLLLLSFACEKASIGDSNENPPAAGFNLEASDQEAIAIADEVMNAMGGRKAWDATRYIGWSFFGRRNHLWDKLDHKVKIEVPADSLTLIVQLKDQTGRVIKNGVEITQQDSVLKYIGMGYRWWINDSYWLVMPFKLKDSGVTLKYHSEGKTTSDEDADILQLTFEEVGVTPQNKYLVYVDKESRLVTQWDYYPSYEDTVARFQSQWPDYQQYGDLLLCGGQIAGNKLTDIFVADELETDPFSHL